MTEEDFNDDKVKEMMAVLALACDTMDTHLIIQGMIYAGSRWTFDNQNTLFRLKAEKFIAVNKLQYSNANIAMIESVKNDYHHRIMNEYSRLNDPK